MDIDEFAQQFIINSQHEPINLYFIDHLALIDKQFNLQVDNKQQLKVTRVAINSFINSFNPNNQITTHKLYRDYLAYLSRTATPNRKLIENIFYLQPELIQFVQLYLFNIVKLAGILSSSDAANSTTGTRIISCDPIFHHLVNELKPYHPSAVEFFYAQVSDKLQMQIWELPIGMPIGLPIGMPVGMPIGMPNKSTSRLAIFFKKQELHIKIPEIITKMSTDDITNLDMLLEANMQSPNNYSFIGKINNTISLDDIKVGLEHIFQENIIDKELRVPRRYIPQGLQPIQILITPPLIPTPNKLSVLVDIAHQLTLELIPHHCELINRELILLQPELDILALEWELKIQRFIKIQIQIKTQNI